MALTVFSLNLYRKCHRVKMCDKSRYQRSPCKMEHLMTSFVNIYFCRRSLESSHLETVVIITFPFRIILEWKLLCLPVHYS